MFVTMPKDHPAAELVIGADRVRPGEAVEVDEETAVSLLDQGWTKANAKQTAAAKKAADEPASSDADPEES